jgi:hypothetical protein
MDSLVLLIDFGLMILSIKYSSSNSLNIRFFNQNLSFFNIPKLVFFFLKNTFFTENKENLIYIFGNLNPEPLNLALVLTLFNQHFIPCFDSTRRIYKFTDETSMLN